ncbi:MAG: tetraacyldisaccharide 4'-kinase [Acidobacteriota bacterium]
MHRQRVRWWAKRASRLPRPVISIGNLHWGGGGKTPLTAAVATHLRVRGLGVAILSRGYGSRGDGVRVVSRGEGPLLGPRLAGDEPVLLAGDLPGVAVVVCGDRALAGRHALERLDAPPDVFLLDDGFSHLRLHRDLDVLAFPAADPFAGGRLPPSGRLREPLDASRRADAVVLTGGRNALGDSTGHGLAKALRAHGFAGPGFTAPTEAEPARDLAGQTVAVGTRVFVLSAIARPGPFLQTVRDQGFEIVEDLALPDHHRYPDGTLRAIEESFDASGAEIVVTTAKDRVKLQGRFERPLAEIPIRARPEAELFHWLDQRLDALGE